MILLALTAAAQVPITDEMTRWTTLCVGKGKTDVCQTAEPSSRCQPYDIPCLDADVIRLEKIDAKLKADEAERLRINGICGIWDLLNPWSSASVGWSELKAAKSRACRARFKASYDAMGVDR